MKKVIIVSFFLFLFLNLPFIFNFSIDDLNKPEMFEDEICSYNGDAVKSGDTIKCLCYEEYANDIFSTPRKINNVEVQCNYEKKRRFITLFLSIFLPFGMDYLYLGHYWLFALIFFACWFTLIGNCVRFAVSSHIDYLKNKKNFFFVVMALLMIIWWILNVVLIWTGIMTDGNGVETVDDIDYLIRLNN
jgi:hypothetical protein